MNIVDDFNKKKYVVLKEVLSPDYCNEAVDYFFKLFENNKTVKDQQCPLSDSIYGDSFFDKLLNDLTDFFSDVSGKKLTPTYSYGRIYRKGEELKIHRDRPACEISATLTLGLKGYDWPIYFGDSEDKKQYSKLILEAGDAVLYKGCEAYHWREQFEGEWQCQVFLHYVDSEGPYKDEKYDGRPNLGIPKNEQIKELNVFYYWQFENVLTPEYCDFIINKYSSKINEKGKIGGELNNTINLEIRNVNNLMLPLHQDIGAHLIGNAFMANQQAWNFNINTCNQIEYLKYDVTGRYKAHVDMLFDQSLVLQRKLTTLAFLNDDFKGGKLFLQLSNEKLYPLQTKGTVIVFPSYILHGVEDVTEGVRHSVVCWMLGPQFR